MKKWFIFKMIGIVLSLIAIVCIVVSMINKEGNNTFLIIGLVSTILILVLLILARTKEKK